MTETWLITHSEGCWHAIASPEGRAIEACARIEGAAILAALDPQRRTARLLRAIQGHGPPTLAAWCRKHGYRADVPDAPPEPAALATRTRPFA